MSSRKKIAVQNSGIGLISQVVSLLLQIISRKMFIQYIGEELLGLNGTFTSILSTLSLAELGIQNAISYALYRPLAEKNEEKINEIVNVFRLMYRSIGLFFIAASIGLLPILSFFIKDVELTGDIYLFFILQALSSACTYFLAYKRTILFADQKEYLYKTVDMVVNVVFKSLQIFVIIRYHNYYLYLVLQLLQVYLSNIVVHILCNKRYPYLHKERFSKDCAKGILGNAREIFAGRIAGYVYSSTDNLIISKMVSTTMVAYLGNYSTITANLRFLVTSILGPVMPIVGNYMAEEGREKQEEKFDLYTHIRQILALILLVPTLVLIDDFISWWVGPAYVLSPAIKVLLVADIYIFLLYGSCSDFIVGAGLFRQYKIITICVTLLNLVLSLLLVGKMGMAGVLVGTVCSQLLYWSGSSMIVYKYCFQNNGKGYLMYVAKSSYGVFCFIVIFLLCRLLYSRLHIEMLLGQCFLGGILCELVIACLYVLFYCKSRECRELCKMLIPKLKRKHV